MHDHKKTSYESQERRSDGGTAAARVIHTGWRSRGYLPQLDSHGIVQHIIFRLADALPAQYRKEIEDYPALRRVAKIGSARQRLRARLLADPHAADIVEQTILHFHGERYRLLAWCIMPTHVHVLAEQMQGFPLSQVVHSWKSFSANLANKTLRRTGAFWAPEYFDRFMRAMEIISKSPALISRTTP